MQKRIKFLLQGSVIWGAIVVAICIGCLSLIETNNFPVLHVSNIDKIYHFIAYFTLTFAWLLSLKKRKHKYKVLFACIIYGIIIEVLQVTLTMHRTGKFLDFLANTIGGVVALLVYNRFFFKKAFN
jgi:VanZ family protein